jgi:hypothetical protein
VAQDEINQGKVTFVVNRAPKDSAPLEEPHSNDGIDAD